MGTCRLGRWGWKGLSAASRPMSRMWEHRRPDFPECHIPTRIPGAGPEFARFTNFNGSGAVTGGFGFESVMAATSHSSYNALQTSLSGNVGHGGPSLQAGLHLGQVAGLMSAALSEEQDPPGL